MPAIVRVFLVHGRDLHTRDLLRSFLNKLGLQCVEWEEAVSKTGTTMPSVLQAVEAGMSIPVAVVVLLTPDDQGVTKLRYQNEGDAWEDRVLSGQPRLNVIFEAGRATALFPSSTIFVARGRTRKFSDLAGIHILRIGRGRTWPAELRSRLLSAGCEVSEHGTDWANGADFESLAGTQLDNYRRSGWDFRELLEGEELEDLEKANLRDPLEIAFCLASAVQHQKGVPFLNLNQRPRRNQSLNRSPRNLGDVGKLNNSTQISAYNLRTQRSIGGESGGNDQLVD